MQRDRPPGGAPPPAADAQGDRGLTQLISVLERAGIEYWIDSGVLLGLRRDGQLLAWEKDLDLAVRGVDGPRLLATVPEYERLGWRADVNRYRGTLWSLGLQPTAALAAGDLRAAVHVFYEIGDHLWSPQPQIYVPPPAPDVLHGNRSFAGSLLKRAVDRWLYTKGDPVQHGRVSRAPDGLSLPYRVARWCYRRIDRGLMAETWPLSEVYVSLTWVVPTALVLPLSAMTVGGRTLPVPARVDEYLRYRYGEWRTPVSDWCYWEDDGAIVHRNPREVARMLRAGATGRRWHPP